MRSLRRAMKVSIRLAVGGISAALGIPARLQPSLTVPGYPGVLFIVPREDGRGAGRRPYLCHGEEQS
jgi:hypothetical protein